MKKKKAVKETWCPLTGQYTHCVYDHIIERGRELWGVKTIVKDNIAHCYRPDNKAIKKARAIYERIEQNSLIGETLEINMRLALNPKVQEREKYFDDILLYFRGLNATELEVFSILAIYEARISKNDAWPLELLALTEKYSPDAMHGKKQKENALRGWKIAGEQQRQEREPVWERWRAKARELWRKHPEWSKRRVAIEIRKTEPDKPALTTITPKIEK